MMWWKLKTIINESSRALIVNCGSCTTVELALFCLHPLLVFVLFIPHFIPLFLFASSMPPTFLITNRRGTDKQVALRGAV